MRSQPCFVYRIFDQWNRLLYIGLSLHPERRIRNHRTRQPWRKQIHHYTTEECADQDEAYRVESELIAAELPIYNIAKATYPERWKSLPITRFSCERCRAPGWFLVADMDSVWHRLCVECEWCEPDTELFYATLSDFNTASKMAQVVSNLSAKQWFDMDALMACLLTGAA